MINLSQIPGRTKKLLQYNKFSGIISSDIHELFCFLSLKRSVVLNSAQRIIEKFGGQAKLASLLGKTPSTVQYWARAGVIPSRWQGRILALAQVQGIELYPGDFVDIPGNKVQIVENQVEQLPVAQWPGALMIGTLELPVFVLNDGRRIMSRNAATNVLTGKKSGDLESYLNVEGLEGYLPEDLPGQLIEFMIPEMAHKTTIGISAETFLDICTAYVRALDENKLKTDRQRAIAIKAGIFLASCAKTGLVALIDEATGYQYVRHEDALQLKLRLYLAEEMRKWESTFPDELWREFGRLTHWRGSLTQRPKYWGRLVMELIYEYLEPDVAEWLRKHNPNPKKGQNHHQWLTQPFGVRKLLEHIWMVIGLAKACQSMRELKVRMAEIYGRQPVQYTLFLPPPSEPAQSPRYTNHQSLNNGKTESQMHLEL
jgi:hypothetical protein